MRLQQASLEGPCQLRGCKLLCPTESCLPLSREGKDCSSEYRKFVGEASPWKLEDGIQSVNQRCQRQRLWRMYKELNPSPQHGIMSKLSNCHCSTCTTQKALTLKKFCSTACQLTTLHEIHGRNYESVFHVVTFPVFLLYVVSPKTIFNIEALFAGTSTKMRFVFASRVTLDQLPENLH